MPLKMDLLQSYSFLACTMITDFYKAIHKAKPVRFWRCPATVIESFLL